MQNHSEISSFIWNVADDVLRGLFKQHEYGDVILPFVVLRRLDCVLEPNKDKVYELYEKYKSKLDDVSPVIKKSVATKFYNLSKFDLKRLKHGPQNVYINFQNYLSGYSDNVQQVIENFKQDKTLEKHKNNRQYQLVDKFSEVELYPVEPAFQQCYQTTMVSGETDPNRLYSLQTEIENYNVFTQDEVEQFCRVFYDKSIPDEQLQPILNFGVNRWLAIPEEEHREEFRSLIQSYMHLYGYISQIITFQDITWEKLYVYFNYLNKTLPKRKKPNITNVLDAVDLDSLRLQKIHEGAIHLNEEDADLPVISPDTLSVARDPELEFLSEIIRNLNEAYGTNFTEEDKQDIRHVRDRLQNSPDLHKVMVGDNTEANKRKKFDEVLMTILLSYVNDRFEFYKKMEDPKVKGFVGGMLWKEMRRGVE